MRIGPRFSYNTFEALLYWGLFIFGIVAIFFWSDNISIALTLFTFLAVFGYSKMYLTWQQSDEIKRLEESEKLLLNRNKE